MEPTVLQKIQDKAYETKVPFPGLRTAYREEYKKDVRRLNDLFRADLEKEHGMSNHPKKDLLFSKAWDWGHASGLYEVAGIYGDLVELLK